MRIRPLVLAAFLTLGAPAMAAADVLPDDSGAPGTDAGGSSGTDAGTSDDGDGGCSASPMNGGGGIALAFGLVAAGALFVRRRT